MTLGSLGWICSLWKGTSWQGLVKYPSQKQSQTLFNTEFLELQEYVISICSRSGEIYIY